MNNTAKTILIALIVGAVGFGGGMYYDSTKTPASSTPTGGQARTGGAGGTGANFRAGGRNAGGSTMGEILKSDAQSITIKLPNGGSQIIFFSDTTKLSKSVDATKDDLKVGQTIQINGTPNTDGSIAATTIQLRAALPTPTIPGAAATATTPAPATPAAAK